MKIPQYEPWIGKEELNEIVDTVKSTWISEGPKVKLFENKFAKLCNTKYAIAVKNGTAALFLALKAMDIGKGDEVIVPDFTFIATATAVELTGAKPILVDVDPKTFNIDPTEISKALTYRTKAIIPVHIYGQPADMDRINRIAHEHNIKIIEDACEAHLAKYNNKVVGSLGDAGCFSFYANKIITTGEGGLVTTNDKDVYKKCRMIRDYGRREKGSYVHDIIGYNLRMTDLEASIGIAQLSKLDQIMKKKQQILELYKNKLSVKLVKFPYTNPQCESVSWFVNILVDDPTRIIKHLKEKNIGCRRFFLPIHRQPCFNVKGNFPNADYAYAHGLSLPSGPLLTEEDIDKVCTHIREVL